MSQHTAFARVEAVGWVGPNRSSNVVGFLRFMRITDGRDTAAMNAAWASKRKGYIIDMDGNNYLVLIQQHATTEMQTLHWKRTT